MRILLFASILFNACASWLPKRPEEKSFYKKAQSGELAKNVERLTGADKSLTGTFPLTAGTDAFIARINLIQQASESIDMQYYIYREDITGNFMNYTLYHAAKRGVRIRLLLDDLNTKDKDEYLNYLNSFPNVEIRLFNPSPTRTFKNLGFLFNYSKLNHRMHNKSFTVDGRVSVIGGRNVGDEYFGASYALDFGDFDLLLIGKVVDDIENQFDLYWNSEFTYALEDFQKDFKKHEYEDGKKRKWERELELEVAKREDYRLDLERSPIVAFTKGAKIPWRWGDARLYHDDPVKVVNSDAELLIDGLRDELIDAKSELLIVSPYFIPGDGGTKKLGELIQKGVKVRIITNSLASTDVIPVYSGYAPYRKPLLELGAQLYEVKVHPEQKPKSFSGSSTSSLHAKTIIIDHKKIFVGSLNLDPRSVDLNTELGVVFENKEFAHEMESKITASLTRNTYELRLNDGDIEWVDQGKQKTFTKSPDASWLRRMSAFFFRILPIESQL